MLKMIDVFEPVLVQNFLNSLSTPTEYNDEFLTAIINSSDTQLRSAMTHFFNQPDAKDVAQALDIDPTDLQMMQTGVALKQDHLTATAKIVALCLALESDTLQHVDVAESLVDYPM